MLQPFQPCADAWRERQGNLGRIDKVAYRVLDADGRRLDRADYWLVVLDGVDGEVTFHDEHSQIRFRG